MTQPFGTAEELAKPLRPPKQSRMLRRVRKGNQPYKIVDPG